MTFPPLRPARPIASLERRPELLHHQRFQAANIETTGAFALVVLAVAFGGFLRFFKLAAYEMSADEGASWAVASTSSMSQVLQLQPLRNPGKFAVHEIALHGWMRLFGDSLATMRALSAVMGTLGIVAVFFLARELFTLGGATNEQRQSVETPFYALPAAFASVLFAVNLVFIKYAREARMYSVATLCALMQIGFFLRMLRRPTLSVRLFTALFTALAIASTFTMLLILAPEMVWLAYLVLVHEKAIWRRATFAVLALTAGLGLLLPPLIIYLHGRAHAPPLLAYAWASPPPLWAPFSMFNKATGSIAFPLILAVAVWAVFRGWPLERDGIVFMLLWMLIPPILVLAASYLIRPAFVERYLLASFVPFFLLIALGIWKAPGGAAQTALMVLVVLLSLGHDYSYLCHPHDVQWREAARAATVNTGGTIVVAPPYAADVVRYYLRESRGEWLVEGGPQTSATVAIVSDSGVSPAEAARMTTIFPRLLLRLRGVIVRGR
jgi:mannosyltransferase